MKSNLVHIRIGDEITSELYTLTKKMNTTGDFGVGIFAYKSGGHVHGQPLSQREAEEFAARADVRFVYDTTSMWAVRDNLVAA